MIAHFSSAGCQTLPGNFCKGHCGTWALFRHRAGLDPDDSKDKWNARYVYVLLTGREARLASRKTAGLNRLRFGSSGPLVEALQLGLKDKGLLSQNDIDRKMGAKTTMAYIEWQKTNNNGRADGIVTPSIGKEFSFNLIKEISNM